MAATRKKAAPAKRTAKKPGRPTARRTTRRLSEAYSNRIFAYALAFTLLSLVFLTLAIMR